MIVDRSLDPEDYAPYIGIPFRDGNYVVQGYIEDFGVVEYEHFRNREVFAILDTGIKVSVAAIPELDHLVIRSEDV